MSEITALEYARIVPLVLMAVGTLLYLVNVIDLGTWIPITVLFVLLYAIFTSIQKLLSQTSLVG